MCAANAKWAVYDRIKSEQMTEMMKNSKASNEKCKSHCPIKSMYVCMRACLSVSVYEYSVTTCVYNFFLLPFHAFELRKWIENARKTTNGCYTVPPNRKTACNEQWCQIAKFSYRTEMNSTELNWTHLATFSYIIISR